MKLSTKKEPLTNDSVDSLMRQSVFLVPAQSTGDFAERYVAALQRRPACDPRPCAGRQAHRVREGAKLTNALREIDARRFI